MVEGFSLASFDEGYAHALAHMHARTVDALVYEVTKTACRFVLQLVFVHEMAP